MDLVHIFVVGFVGLQISKNGPKKGSSRFEERIGPLYRSKLKRKRYTVKSLRSNCLLKGGGGIGLNEISNFILYTTTQW